MEPTVQHWTHWKFMDFEECDMELVYWRKKVPQTNLSQYQVKEV